MPVLSTSSEELIFRRGRREALSQVYFVEAVGLGLVKIGTATNVYKRIPALAVASPVSLRLRALAPGGRAAEKDMHILFAKYSSHGEWFHLAPAVEEMIEKHAVEPITYLIRGPFATL